MLQVLGQVNDTLISFQIYYQRQKNLPLTPQQTRYVMEASNYTRIDITPKQEHYDYIRDALGIFSDIKGGMAFFVKSQELMSALLWLDSTIPDANDFGSGQIHPFHTSVNSLVSYGGADNTLKRVFGASTQNISNEPPTLLRNKSVDLTGLYPVHKRVTQLREEGYIRRCVSEPLLLTSNLNHNKLM